MHYPFTSILGTCWKLAPIELRSRSRSWNLLRKYPRWRALLCVAANLLRCQFLAYLTCGFVGGFLNAQAFMLGHLYHKKPSKPKRGGNGWYFSACGFFLLGGRTACFKFKTTNNILTRSPRDQTSTGEGHL
eukprot:2690932-Amphidinium_carterae.1